MRMQTVSAKSKTLSDLLKKARRKDLFLQSADGEQYVLARVTDLQAFYIGSSDHAEREIEMTRKNKRLSKFLDGRGAASKTGKKKSLAQVRQRLGLS
jgi:hypothetical protein